MLNTEYRKSLTDLNARIRLLKDRVKLLKTIKDNKGNIDKQDMIDIKQSLMYCSKIKRTIKANTAVDNLYQSCISTKVC